MKKLFIVAFCLLIVVSWYSFYSSTVGKTRDVENYFEQARQMEERELYVNAIELYEKALAEGADREAVLVAEAADYRLMGDEKNYISTLQSIVSLNVNNEAALRELAEVLKKGSEITYVSYMKGLHDQYPEQPVVAELFQEVEGFYTESYYEYEGLSTIFDNMSRSFQDGKYGLVTDDLSPVLRAQYAQVEIPFEESPMIAVQQDGRYIYVSAEGYKLADPIEGYEKLGTISDGRAYAQFAGLYGYLDEKQVPVTDFIWDEAGTFMNGVAAVRKGDKWAIIDKKGKEITDYIFDAVAMDEMGCCATAKVIWVKQNGSYSLINLKGETVGDAAYEDVKPFYTTEPAAVKSGGAWGFADVSGNLVIACEFEDAQSFGGGFGAVQLDGLWGYVDRDDYLCIKPQFEDAKSMSPDGVAPVKIGDYWKVIKLRIFN